MALVEDASGSEAYYYGNQGEVVKTVRSVMVSTADVRTYVYGATYDSWNRVRTMTYPDGEVVTYHYNAAGQIVRLSGNKQGHESVVIDRIGYGKDGHTVYTKLGNGTETTYTYDKQRERLQAMNFTADGRAVMENKYQYDAVDNILGITNAVDTIQAANSNNNNSNNNSNSNKAKLGGAFNHTYAYDDLNRLIKANGKAKSATYEMQMTFGRMSEPLTKVQKVDSTRTAQSYDFTYRYEDDSHPTAPTQVGHDHYTYDANGNPILVENDSLNTERIVKSHGDLEGVYINGAPQGISFHETEDYTIYPAPIITVTKNRFTKHYFIGSKRIASKIGTGRFSNVYGIGGNNITAGQKDYAARMMQIEKQREEYYKQLGTPPGVPTMKGATADPDNTGIGYNSIITDLGDHSVPEGWIQHPKFNGKGDVPGPPIQWSEPESPDNAQPGYGYIPADTTDTEDIFFYHSDHLGSTSYITDAKANITQFDAYLPYGELLVDEHSSSEELPYKFNGKEMDEETGLYYYGARYLNPVASIWYGVDPLAEKYSMTSGYVYTLANPVRLIDIDGRKNLNFDQDGRFKGITHDNWWHNLWFGTRGVKYHKDGSKRYFKFASDEDAQNIINHEKKGEPTHLFEISKRQIIEYANKAGAYSEDNANHNMDFMATQAVGGGSLDFSVGPLLEDYQKYGASGDAVAPSLVYFLPEGDNVAHNQFNFGNFLYGFSGRQLGVALSMLKIGGHINSLVNSAQNGYKPQLDSSDDQYSIEKGYFYSHKGPKVGFIAYEINVPTYRKGAARKLIGKF